MDRDDGGQAFMGQVITAPALEGGGWRVTIDVDGSARAAFVPAQLRAVRAGDTVTARKTSSTWVVDQVITAHPVPAVSTSMGAKPPAAVTTSGDAKSVPGGNIPRPPVWPRAPRSGVGSTLSQMQVWAENTRAYLLDLEAWTQDMFVVTKIMADQVNDLRDAVNTNASRLSSARDALNTNASRLNQTRDYAGTASDAIGGVVGALRDERIVR